MPDSLVLRYFIELARLEAPGIDDTSSAQAAVNALETRPRLVGSRGPAIASFACVAGDAVLNLFDPDVPPYGRGPDWLVVPRAGPVLRARLKPGFRPLRSQGSELYGVVRDGATGLDHLVVADLSALSASNSQHGAQQ